MAFWRQLSHGLHVLLRRDRADRDLDEEMRAYLEEAADAYEEAGLPAALAQHAARRDVGDPLNVRERVRDAGWESVAASWMSDLRLSARTLRRSPVFTAVVVVLLSLGSGAVTTIFSAINAMVLRPLPGVTGPSRLVSLQPVHADGTTSVQASVATVQALGEQRGVLSGLAAWGRVSITIAAGGETTAVYGNMVTASYFDVLGVRPRLGRFFAADEDRVLGGHPLVVVSERFWRTHLAADPDAIGRAVRVNGHPFTLIGVAPDGFHGVYTGLPADAWVPVTMQPQLRPRSNPTAGSWLWMFGRLADRVDHATARAQLATLLSRDATPRASGSGGRGAISGVSVTALTGLPGGEGGAVLGFMSLLLGAALLVLLIAGVNVASLLSARYVARQRELAVRAALGAGRGRLLRHLLAEVLWLFAAGAAGGFAVAVAATAALERLPLPATLPVSLELSPDVRVLAFALAVTMSAALLFGLWPALRAVRRDVTVRLREATPGAGVRRGLAGRALIAGQLALSLLLLVVAGLFMRALDRGGRVDPGFDTGGIAVVSLEPEAWGYDEARSRAFYHRLRERVATMPGVISVSSSNRVPLMFGQSVDQIDVGGRAVPAHYVAIAPGYFQTLRLPLAQGRDFVESDGQTAPRVAIVNQTMAQRVWPGGALGQTFRYQDEVTTVIGVARDAKYASLDETAPAFVYFPIAQVWRPTQVLLVRTAGAPETLGGSLQDAVVALDPLIARPRVTTLARATAIVLLPQRAAALVTGVLGAAGLLMAAVGLYGILAYAASRRTREIGVRMALGAGRRDVVSMMVADGMWLSAMGVAAGLAAATAATRLVSPWLFGVSPLDAGTFAGMSAVLLAVAWLASYLPARRAAGADPAAVLKAE